MKGYDSIGSIAILKFKDEKISEKIKIARSLLKERNNIQTVVEKLGRIKGRLRTIKTRWLAGKKTLETIHKESGCLFKLNIETCYFSPRLSSERLEIAEKCKKEDRVLVLFAGVGPYPVIIAKKSESKVVSVELGRECCKYARENVQLNKLNNIEVIQGDAKKLEKLVKGKFDVIVMPRPQLKDTFLEYIWKFCKKGTRIYYYDFGKIEKILERVKSGIKKSRKKMKILGFKKAGDIAPYMYRWRVDLLY